MEEKATYLSKDIVPIEALNGSSFLYRNWIGKTLKERFTPFLDYTNLMKLNGVFPFGRTLISKVGNKINVEILMQMKRFPVSILDHKTTWV
jgi:hypothetical protein